MKSLVVYYTRTGNAKFVAETIAATMCADIEQVIDLKNRNGILGYLSGGKDATQGKETQIEETKKSPKEYDLIIVGQPVWASSPTPAIRTYLNHNDLSGKKVALFFTQSTKKQQVIEKTKALISDCEFAGVLSLVEPLKNKEDAEKSITEWCKTFTS